MAQIPVEGFIAKQNGEEGNSSGSRSQAHSAAAMEFEPFEMRSTDRSQSDYQVELWESFEEATYPAPEFWTSTNEEWMYEPYETYSPPVPIIDGEIFALMFGGWEVSIDTLITPLLNIANG